MTRDGNGSLRLTIAPVASQSSTKSRLTRVIPLSLRIRQLASLPILGVTRRTVL